MSSLTAHMVLPAGDAKPSWDSAARTISISDFGQNLSGTSYLQGNEKQQVFFEVGCLIFKVQRANCIPIVSKCFMFLLINAPLCDMKSLDIPLPQPYSFSCKKAPNTGLVSISLLLSGGEPLIGAGADGD